ncbi:patatin-like phospholipase family protein [Methylobacterium planeticum]|uniref:Patatin-like phospholipase family protein n=1 Tax=Methylobacterium planeticum TaxID=2615211 RepID=A0A6N6MSV8_9HYPH|nr:patatin-like phospholipase family protein [Methylobacterium planeticum]KAB1073473.1 patatin-like phospholipase family protein [Methylobacterium planeticum]
MPEIERDLAMIFAGGNAVGAYHSGAYEALHHQGLRPGWVVGASIGAVTAAIIAGNAPEDRVDKLRTFWDEATQGTGPSPSALLKPRQVYNGLHALLALAWGRPNIFRHRLPGLWSALPWVPNDVALFDNAPLLQTLNRLVDFERLNRGDTRLTVCCVDIETGEEVYFDTSREVVRPEHILASTAILPAFPPVELDGRVLCDAGYTNNLPLDPVFAAEPPRDLLCIASDLFSLRAPRPASLDAVLERANDLIFASAPRRAISGLRREYDLRQRLDPNGPTVTLLHLIYQAGADELAAKSFDFSPSSIRDRWAAGGRDAVHGLRLLALSEPDAGRFNYVTLPGRPHNPLVAHPDR